MNYLKYILVIFLFSTLSACLKDTGNYTYKDLRTFYIDTAGMPISYTLMAGSAVADIAPKVVYDGDTANLSFLWRLYNTPTTYDTLSDARVLNARILVSEGTYPLEFIVTEKGTGLRAFMRYSIVISTALAVPSGWMVAYERNDSTDVDLIRATNFISNVTRDTVYRNIYSRANNGPMAGLPKSIAYLSSSAGTTYLFTTKDAGAVSNNNFKRLLTFSQMFAGNSDPVYDFKGFNQGTASQGICVNGKWAYWGNTGYMVGKIVLPDGTDHYQAAPQVVYLGTKAGLLYDQQGMRFLCCNQISSTSTTFDKPTSTAARFGLDSIGKQLIHLERGYGTGTSSDPNKYGIFKDVTGDNRYLYVIDPLNTSRPDKALIDISTAPDILNAKFYTFSNLGPAAYYATATAVYSFTFNTDNNNYTTPAVGFTAPAGETISTVSLFKAYLSSATGAYDSRLLLVGTWNETEKTGKVYLLKANETSGVIEATPLKVWNVAGKPGAMFYKTL